MGMHRQRMAHDWKGMPGNRWRLLVYHTDKPAVYHFWFLSLRIPVEASPCHVYSIRSPFLQQGSESLEKVFRLCVDRGTFHYGPAHEGGAFRTDLGLKYPVGRITPHTLTLGFWTYGRLPPGRYHGLGP